MVRIWISKIIALGMFTECSRLVKWLLTKKLSPLLATQFQQETSISIPLKERRSELAHILNDVSYMLSLFKNEFMPC